MVDGAFSGSPFGAIGWFSALTAATLACLYLAMGYAHTKWKATGALRAHAARRGTVTSVLATVLVLACLVAVNRTAAPLNLSRPGPAIAFAVLLLFAAAGVGLTLVTLRPASRYDVLPITGLVTATVTLAGAVVVARYPVLIPPALTLDDTVSPPTTMVFIAVGIGLNVPLLLFYTWFAQRTFRGKVVAAPEDRDLPTAA